MSHRIPQKIDLTPRRHHGFQVFLFFLGWLLPPLAVAARFGIGKDFFINVILTCCGYIPGHGHNFYIQNIRNNTNKARTPKWAIRYGLVNNADRERAAKKSQWAKRYDERLPESTHVGQQLEDGEEGPNYMPYDDADPEYERRQRNEGLWTRNEEEFYNEDEAPNKRHWHYPANFEGAASGGGGRGKINANAGGDRWERTRSNRSGSSDTYPPTATNPDADVPEWGREYGSKRRSSRGGKKKRGSIGSTENYPSAPSNGAPPRQQGRNPDDVFNHEF